jgi:hypothetical protein
MSLYGDQGGATPAAHIHSPRLAPRLGVTARRGRAEARSDHKSASAHPGVNVAEHGQLPRLPLSSLEALRLGWLISYLRRIRLFLDYFLLGHRNRQTFIRSFIEVRLSQTKFFTYFRV